MNDYSSMPDRPEAPKIPVKPVLPATPMAGASRGHRTPPREPAPRFGRGLGSLPIVYPANSRHVGEASASAASAQLPAGGVPVRRAVRVGGDVGLSRRTREARVRAKGFTVWVVSCVVSAVGVGVLVWVLLAG